MYHYIKIVNVSLSVCNESGKFGGQDYSSVMWFCTYYIFVLCVCDKKQNDVFEEQQLKRKWSGSSSISGRNRGAAI